MEGAQSIGRRGDALCAELSESPSALNAALGTDEFLEGDLKGGEVLSCAIAGVCMWVKRRASGDGRRGDQSAPLLLYF